MIGLDLLLPATACGLYTPQSGRNGGGGGGGAFSAAVAASRASGGRFVPL